LDVNYSVVEGGCGMCSIFSTIITSDPMLGTLTDNGGLTNTMALGNGSSAIDAAGFCIATDQRGVSRPQGAGCDIGAYELDDTPPNVTVNQATSQSDPTNASPILFAVVFDETIDVSTFTNTDITLGGSAPGTLSASLIQVAPNDGTTFEVSVSGMTGPGTVTASIEANIVQDPAGNNNAASTSSDNTVTYDNLTPIVIATSLQTSYTNAGPGIFTVTFSKNVNNAGNGTNSNDAGNINNYQIVEDGLDGVLDTTSCLGGLAGDDTNIPVSSVIYAPNTAIVNLSAPPPLGNYRLFVCGTTSIVDLAMNELNGGLSDYTFDFIVTVSTTGTGTGGGTGSEIAASSLPKTGFAPNKITSLPAQPATLAYAELGDLWLEIPLLNVKSTIVGVPQNKDNSWDVSWLGNDTGWLNGTAFPTWNGNSVLTAHVTNASGLEGPFAALKSLKYGDQIIVHFGGVKYVYEVRNTRLARPYSTSYAFQSLQDHSYLTLVTCSGYNPLNESYLFRRVVRAVLVEVK